jgi:preprotein translocase subunit YajC
MEMGGEFDMNEKLFSWIITVAFLVCLYFLLSVYRQNRELEKYRDNSIEQIKIEKEKVIKSNYDYIDSLKSEINSYQISINKANTTIDSLSKVKSKVKYIYIEKIKEIQGLNANSLTNYWKNELSN